MIELTPDGWYGLLLAVVTVTGTLAIYVIYRISAYINDRREEDHEHRMRKLDYYHEEVMSSPEARAAMADGSGIELEETDD